MNNNDLSTYIENLKIENEDKIQKYKNWDKNYKQEYWNNYIFQYWKYGSDTWEAVDISKIREDVLEYEPNFDDFLPWVIKSLEEEWLNINSILILDEQAKKALEISNQTSNTSNWVKSTIDTENTNKLENISFEVLAEKIWDLYYDALAFFLEELSENIKNTEIKELIKEASYSISKAWDLCKIPTEEFLKKAEKEISEWKEVFFKHSSEVKWLNIEKKELAKIIWNLENSELSDLLEKLSEKMQKDWDADYYRKPIPRKKLGTELYACANKLKQASEII